MTVVEFGKWNYRELAKKPKEKLDEFWKYFEQFLRREAKDAEVNNGEGMVLICDWEGFSLNRHASKEGESVNVTVCPTLQTNAPCRFTGCGVISVT